MKKILLIFILLFTSLTFSQETDSLVDVFDQKRRVIKLRATPKQVDEIKNTFPGDTLFIQKKVDGKWWECKYVRRKLFTDNA